MGEGRRDSVGRVDTGGKELAKEALEAFKFRWKGRVDF